MGERKNGKRLALWMSADDQTAPVIGDVVAFITGTTLSSRATSANLTAGGDSGAVKAGGIPDASVRFTGRLDTTAAGNPLLAAHNDQQHRQFKVMWDDTVEIGPIFVGHISEYSQSTQHTAPWDISFMVDVTGQLTEDRTP